MNKHAMNIILDVCWQTYALVFLGYTTKSRNADSRRKHKCLAWVQTALKFPKLFGQISSPTNNVQSSSCPTSSPTVGIVNPSNFSHCAKITLCTQCVGVFWHGSNLYLLN